MHHAAHHAFTAPDTIPFVVPLILVLPLVAFVLLAMGVRTRRSAANLGMAGVLLALVAALWTAAVRFGDKAAYVKAYQWINVPVATTGPTQFQGFGIDINLTADHAGLTVLVACLAVVVGVAAWSRRGARSEPGYVRGYAMLALLALGAAGVCMSGDMAEMAAFWAITGAATYLLLAQRWGDAPSGGPARWALALPFGADLALFCAVGLLYSRYGHLTLATLPPLLHTTAGAGLKSLTAAGVLVVAAAAGRGALFPLQGWLTAAKESPPAPRALAAGVWPLLSALLVFRFLPVLHAAGPQALTVAGAVGLAAGVALPLRGLAGNDVRLVLTGMGAGQLGLVLVALAKGSAGVALTAAAAGGLARAAALLAAAGIAAAMRTNDLSEMAQALRRMPVSAAALALAGAAVAVSGGQAAALGLGGAAWPAVYGIGLFLVGAAAARVYAGASHGRLRRRRSFDPERIKEAEPSMALPAVFLAALALAAGVLTFSTRWLHFVDVRPHAHPPATATLLWLAVAAAGVAAGLALYAPLRRRLGDRLSARAGAALGGARAGAAAGLGPVLAVARLPVAADRALADAPRAAAGGGGRPRAPGLSSLPRALPALAAAAIVAAAIVHGIAPG